MIKLYLNHVTEPITEVTDLIVQLPAFVEEDFITPVLEVLNIAIEKEFIAKRRRIN